MDRNLKWRMIILAGILAFCAGTLAPTFAGKGTLPSWFTAIFSKKIDAGLVGSSPATYLNRLF